jgi:putative redox protein
MRIEIAIKEGFKTEATVRGHLIKSDQDCNQGGEDCNPNPFEYFLASTGMCIAHYINSFCKQRDIDTSKIKVLEHATRDENNRLKIDFKIELSSDFPEKYKKAILKAAEGCTVKKAITEGADFELSLA